MSFLAICESDPMDAVQYASMFGPTTGDRVRLGDTSLWVQVENDYTVYGDECKFGGGGSASPRLPDCTDPPVLWRPGKTLRDGQGQASDRSDAEVLDLIITNALIIDWSGIYKADIGVKDGIIVGIGKGGNPDMMDGVTEGMIVGSSTEVIAGEKMIITAGAIDAHVHYICVDLWREVSRIQAAIGCVLKASSSRPSPRESPPSSAAEPVPQQEPTLRPAPRASST